MQSVYFFEENAGKDVKKILKEDTFMRISYTIIESDQNDRKGKGYFLYVQANPDEADLLEKRFKDLKISIEKLTGKEEQDVIDMVNKNEENAASGMGMIFG